MTVVTEEQTSALAAAAEASEAVSALLRFAREGDAIKGWAFDVEVAAHLGSALQAVLAIELPRMNRPDDVPATRDTAEELQAALTTFLEAWA